MYLSIKENENMKPKERVMCFFHHTEPDRVPINYHANSGIHSRLARHFALKADDTETLLNILGVDFRGIGARYKGNSLHKKVPDRRVNPEWGIRTRWIEHNSGGYWDYCDFPLKNATEEEAAAWPMPSPDDYDYSAIPDACERKKTFALYTGNAGLCDIINSTSMLRTMEQVLIDLATDEPAGLLLIDRRLEIQLEVTMRVIESAKGKIDFLWMGEDLGTQYTPLLSLALYRKHLRPRHQKFVDLAKAYGLPVMIHSCGSSSWAFEDYIAMGINAVDTLQPEAKNMNPYYIKKNYGNRIAFHGCISTAGAVAYGSVQDVINNVKDTYDIMKPGGGYCFAPTHAIQDNSPTQNVIAMYQAAHKYGMYKR